MLAARGSWNHKCSVEDSFKAVLFLCRETGFNWIHKNADVLFYLGQGRCWMFYVEVQLEDSVKSPSCVSAREGLGT